MTAVFPGHASQEADLAAARRPARPSACAEAERADALFALALGLVNEGDEDDEGDSAVRAVLGAAGTSGDRAVLTGAYGRALAFSADYPEDPAARQTVQVLARALSHHHRHRAVAPPA